MKKIILPFLIILLAACAKTVPPPQESDTSTIWQAMQDASAKADKPFRMQLSMRFGEEGNTRRVTALLWGNNADAIRLDVQAGVGATIAMISERGDDFALYTPRDNKAWIHRGPNRPMLKIGVPVPFDLAKLAGLLTGNFTQVFGSEPKSGQATADGAEFALGGALAGTLEVNPQGEPLSWRQSDGAWRLALGYDEDAPYLPRSLRLENKAGKRAIILVKERETLTAPFTARQLELNIPPGAEKKPLSDYKPS